MPLALLLQKTIKALSTGVKQLDNWNQLVQLEQLLIGRARSAFLVHWFGTPLPLHGAHLRVVISNIAALQSRYQAIRAANSQAGGPNLLKPLAGMSGSLAGMLLSPIAGIGVSIGAIKYGWHQKKKNWLVIILASVNLITFGALIPIVGVIGLAGGTGAALLIGSGATPSEPVLNAYILLGAAAQMLLALNDLLGQLLGPRTAIRNPLLANLLALADKLADLLPLLLAGFALLITRISGLLVPLASQIVLLYEVIQKMSELISEVIDDLLKHLDELTKPHSPFMMIVRVMNLLTAVMNVLEQDTRMMLQPLVQIFQIRASLVSTVLANTLKQIKALHQQKPGLLGTLFSERGQETSQQDKTRTDPINAYIRDLKESFQQTFAYSFIRVLITSYEHLSILHHLLEPPPSSAPPSTTKLVLGKAYGALTALLSRLKKSGGKGDSSTFKDISAFLGAPVPDTDALKKQKDEIDREINGAFLSLDSDTINKVADAIDAQRAQLGLHYTLSEKAWRAVVDAEQPIDVFKAERVIKTKQAQKAIPLEQALRDAHREEIQYRSMIFAVVHKVLSPYLDEYIAQLERIFQMIDEYIYTPIRPERHQPAPIEHYPVLELKESSRLQPIIHRLRIHAEHGESADVRTWGDTLQKALKVQSYLVPAET
jgi:hypothetical protein